MAYVGTPSRLGSARDTLASIIQGEAGGEGLRGMQAVAQVITNRANQNFSGYGSDLISQATARNQFQGQSTRISSDAYRVADQALAGQLPDVVGSGAVNYANPGASTARWATNLDSSNAYQLGNHFFTDNTKGIPYAGPTGGLGSPMNSNDPLQYTGPSGFQTAGTGSSQYYGDAGNGAITSFKSNADGSAEVTLGDDSGSVGAGQGISASSFSGANVAGAAGAGSFGLSGFTSGGQGVGGGLGATGTGANPNGYSLDGATLDPSVSANTVSDPIVGYNAAGPVTANPTLVGATNQVASATAKGTKQIGDDTKTAGETIGKSVTGLGSTLSGISSSWQSFASDYVVRIVFVIVGLIALAAALMMFKPVQNAAAAVVPAGRALKAAKALKSAVPG